MIDTYTLSNGLRLIMERMPHLRSTSIGVWVKAGSMLEKQTENGISHLMEHMAFKGTQRRSARELAEEMDAIGGHMNAATSKLYTAYYAKVCDSDLEKAADILADIVCHPLITQEDLERKKASSPKKSPWSTITLKRMCLTCFMRHSIMDRLSLCLSSAPGKAF